MASKYLPRTQVVSLLALFFILGCGQSRAWQDGEFEIDCSSADPGSRCNPISSSLGCIGSSNATGCVAATNACTTCFFSFAESGEATSQSSRDRLVAGVLSITIVNVGRWEEFGIKKGDVLLQINGNGINDGTDLSKVEELRKAGAVTLKVLRSVQDGYSVIEIEFPQL